MNDVSEMNEYKEHRSKPAMIKTYVNTHNIYHIRQAIILFNTQKHMTILCLCSRTTPRIGHQRLPPAVVLKSESKEKQQTARHLHIGIRCII